MKEDSNKNRFLATADSGIVDGYVGELDDETMMSPALVFGANGEMGRAVVEGLVHRGYQPVYAFTRTPKDAYLTDALGAVIWTGDLQNPLHVRDALRLTKAQAIFLTTTTDMPIEILQTSGFSDAAEAEYQVIVEWFHALTEVHAKDGLNRHVVFAVHDNVQRVVREETLQSQTVNNIKQDDDMWIEPLDDGSIVPHFSAKGRGGEFAVNLLRETPGLKLTLLTMPFLYSNFLAFFSPLPAEETMNQWMLTANFGDGVNKIDMMGAADLAHIVPNVLAKPDIYRGQNLRLVGEQLSMDEIACYFSDLFGKDVIYNPLTFREVARLPFATAPVMAQMCQFLGDPRSLRHDLQATMKAIFPRLPQTFSDWLLTHSESEAFKRVGLDWDAPAITSVCVFGATSPQGTSVVKGLLADTRKEYTVRATTRHLDNDKARALVALDPARVELVYADLDDEESCRAAVDGVGGVFLVTDYYYEHAAGHDWRQQERHAKTVIDACEGCSSVQHLVFSTMESVEAMNHHRQVLEQLAKGSDPSSSPNGAVKSQKAVWNQFDAKIRAAAYARTKKLSCTVVIMPLYTEVFFDSIERRDVDDETGKKLVLSLPVKDDAKLMCMSVDDLGPAVANIFDSYQVYAGHEIGLVTDFVTVEEVKEILDEALQRRPDNGLGQEVTLETQQQCPPSLTTVVKPPATATSSTAPTSPASSACSKQKQGDTYMKDLGQIFAYMAHTDAVKSRHSVARTMKLVPSALPLRQWVEQNLDNVQFREKLGLR